jgi:hypothetical protein
MSKHLHKKGMLYASLFCAVIGALALALMRGGANKNGASAARFARTTLALRA